jgi:hypothetical protein
MLIALFYLVLALGVLVLILLAVVVAGIRREPPSTELSSRAPNPISAMTRRLLGVSVRRPDSGEAGRRDTCLAGHAAGNSADGEGR